jgi:hypothetical protein
MLMMVDADVSSASLLVRIINRIMSMYVIIGYFGTLVLCTFILFVLADVVDGLVISSNFAQNGWYIDPYKWHLYYQ